MFKVNNKAIGFIVNFEHISHLCSSVSIVNFEHVIAGWERFFRLSLNELDLNLCLLYLFSCLTLGLLMSCLHDLFFIFINYIISSKQALVFSTFLKIGRII